MNFHKTRFMSWGERQYVTGAVVNLRPNVPRPHYDQLKAILTNCVRSGPTAQNRSGHADFRAHLSGRIAHVAAVNPARGRKLRAIFDRIQWPAEPGSTTVDPNHLQILAGGSDMWNNADGFRYAYGSYTGDFDFKVRVTRLDPRDIHSKAGFMIRQDRQIPDFPSNRRCSGTSETVVGEARLYRLCSCLFSELAPPLRIQVDVFHEPRQEIEGA